MSNSKNYICKSKTTKTTDKYYKCKIKILRNLQKTKTTNAKLKYLEIFKRPTYYIYPPLRASSDLKLVAYVDAAHGNLSDEGGVRDTSYF